MLVIFIYVSPYEPHLIWVCRPYSCGILYTSNFYNPSSPSLTGFHEFHLMFDCVVLHNILSVVRSWVSDNNWARHWSLTFINFFFHFFSSSFSFYQSRLVLSWVSELNYLWFLAIEGVSRMGSLSWCWLQFGSVIGWPLPQYLCHHYPSMSCRQNRVQAKIRWLGWCLSLTARSPTGLLNIGILGAVSPIIRGSH